MSRPPLRKSVFVLALAAVATPALVAAIDVWVTRYDDPVPGDCLPADCSLREAVIAANGSATLSTIHLSAGTYELTRAGTMEDGSLTGDLDLFNRSVLIQGVAANLTTIDANGIDRVFHFWGPDLVAYLDHVTVTGGSADSSGAGIYVADGILDVSFSEIRGNSPGKAIVASHADTSLIFSTLAENQAAMLVFGGTHDAANVTMNGDLTVQESATFRCRHCTLGDTATGSLVWANSNAVVQLENSALLGSCQASGGGAIFTLDGNLESPGATCGLDLPEDQDNVALPSLGNLQLNGGETRTRLPSVGSPLLGGALDANCLVHDQRSAGRPDVNCDTGAVERLYGSPPARTPLFIDGFGQGDAEAWSSL